MPAFGLDESDLLPGAPIQTVSTGTPQIMIPVKGHDSLRKAILDIEKYTCPARDAATSSARTCSACRELKTGQTFARHFGVPPDTMEDPFTGSATGGMAAYLWHHGLIDSPTFIAEQGHWMNRPGLAHVEVIGPRDDIETVKVGGSAVTVLRGELTI